MVGGGCCARSDGISIHRHGVLRAVVVVVVVVGVTTSLPLGGGGWEVNEGEGGGRAKEAGGGRTGHGCVEGVCVPRSVWWCWRQRSVVRAYCMRVYRTSVLYACLSYERTDVAH